MTCDVTRSPWMIWVTSPVAMLNSFEGLQGKEAMGGALRVADGDGVGIQIQRDERRGNQKDASAGRRTVHEISLRHDINLGVSAVLDEFAMRN